MHRVIIGASSQGCFLLFSWTISVSVIKKHILLKSAWEGSNSSNELIPPPCLRMKCYLTLARSLFLHLWPSRAMHPCPMSNKHHISPLWSSWWIFHNIQSLGASSIPWALMLHHLNSSNKYTDYNIELKNETTKNPTFRYGHIIQKEIR